MRPVTERDIRTSFVNCSKGEAKRLAIPKDLATRPWDDLDFLGWRDPAAPDRAYIVAESGESGTGFVAVALRRAAPTAGRPRRGMCTLCLTAHSGDGVSLMTARKAGRGGQLGNSVGAYMCSDLACSLYLRGKKDTESGARIVETLTVDEQADRATTNLMAFLARITERD